MAQTWIIAIDQVAGSETIAVQFTPSTLTVAVGDIIYWRNNDSNPHWPAPIVNGVIQPTNWMDYQIPGKLPDQPAPTSQQAVSFSGQTASTGLTYGCAITGDNETGTIIVA